VAELHEDQAQEPDVVVITDELAGERVDHALAHLTGFSRSRIHQLISHDAVQLAGKPVKKSRVVEAGERYSLSEVTKSEAPLEVVATEEPTVLYSDDDIIVVDKPVG